MTAITVTFEFEFGDLVFFVHAQHDASCYPTRWPIIERIAQECPAGVQLLYRLVGYKDLVPELALTLEEPAFKTTSQEVINDRIRCDKVRQQAMDKEADDRWERKATARQQKGE